MTDSTRARPITIQGRAYQLPRVLMTCPACKSGSLTWDGCWAWRCDARWTTKRGGRACSHGVSLSGLFDAPDLHDLFQLRAVNLRRLPRTGYCLKLLTLGVLSFPWLSRVRAGVELSEWEASHVERERADELDRLVERMLRWPLHPEYHVEVG